jgi:hypothetical protein
VTTTIRKGLVKRIHVNQQLIARARKSGEDLAALTVQTSRGPVPGRRVRINGPSELVQSLTKPLACGARVWIYTRAEVEIEEYYSPGR